MNTITNKNVTVAYRRPISNGVRKILLGLGLFTLIGLITGIILTKLFAASFTFTEDFSGTLKKDISATTADWDTTAGCLKLPVGGAWIPTTTTGAASARSYHTAVWNTNNTTMIVWGGDNGSTYLNTGKIYNPSTNTWLNATSLTNAPVGRYRHTAVWDSTNNKMIVWGGAVGSTTINTGGVYDPALDSWTTITTTNAPTRRWYHAAVWASNINKMIIWGGSDNATGNF